VYWDKAVIHESKKKGATVDAPKGFSYSRLVNDDR